jgi:hypothetical protein
MSGVAAAGADIEGTHAVCVCLAGGNGRSGDVADMHEIGTIGSNRLDNVGHEARHVAALAVEKTDDVTALIGRIGAGGTGAVIAALRHVRA